MLQSAWNKKFTKLNMKLLEKYSDKIDTFVGVCHHLAEKQYVTGHGGNLAWKLEDNFLPFLQKYNGFLMENHGYVFLTPWDIFSLFN